jgi:S-adenosylhomocysteine hydrolase
MSTTLHPTLGVNSPLDRPAFKVADLSLADWGRKEIRLAEHEMPGPDGAARRVRGQKPRSRAPASWARCT